MNSPSPQAAYNHRRKDTHARIDLWLDRAETLPRLDSACEAEGMTRAEYIRRAIMVQLDSRRAKVLSEMVADGPDDAGTDAGSRLIATAKEARQIARGESQPASTADQQNHVEKPQCK